MIWATEFSVAQKKSAYHSGIHGYLLTEPPEAANPVPAFESELLMKGPPA